MLDDTKPKRRANGAGTVIFESNKWKAKIWLADKSRALVDLFPADKYPPKWDAKGKLVVPKEVRWACARAAEIERREGKILAAKRGGAVMMRPPALPGESPADWFDGFLKVREAKGETTVIDKRGHIQNHILPVLKHLERMADLSTDDCEAVRNALDAKIASTDPEVHISPKTAANIWATLKAACKEMCRSKRPELRIRRDNPSADVEPPETGDDRSKTFLYPSEFLRLVSCADVPLYWRRLYAVAVYTGCRAGELGALLRSDVDVEHGIISITKAVDRRTGEIKSTKTGKTRDIPIEPNIATLLRVLLAQDGPRWLRMPPDEDRAELLRAHLAKAGVTRAALTADDDLHKPITFHDLRGTYATWAAVRGDDPLRIKQRCGHASFQTTEGYIRAAEVLRAGAGFGVPFPALPAELIELSEELSEPRGNGHLDVAKRSESDAPSTVDPVEHGSRRNASHSIPVGVAEIIEESVGSDSFSDSLGAKLGDAERMRKGAAAAERWDIVDKLTDEIADLKKQIALSDPKVRPLHAKKSGDR